MALIPIPLIFIPVNAPEMVPDRVAAGKNKRDFFFEFSDILGLPIHRHNMSPVYYLRDGDPHFQRPNPRDREFWGWRSISREWCPNPRQLWFRGATAVLKINYSMNFNSW